MDSVNTPRCLTVLLMTLLVLYGTPATPVRGEATKDVVVTNTSANPVPVTGTVSGTVSGTVNAQQSGPWAVGLVGSPVVTMPTHLGVRASAFVALEYVNAALSYTSCTGGNTICASPRQILPDGSRAAFAIPNGTVLVITDIQWQAGGGDEGDSATVYAANIGYSATARFISAGFTYAAATDRFASGIVVSFIPTLVFAHHEPAALDFLFVRGYLASSGQ